ncbi:UDP-glucuronic acid decarboxylase family protein [Pseudacidovorax intermedius]|uniref:UDP-glucuronic acid decarboxylase family protein n=1 Tax=Pseudacidovorax intermedius TaxID=433924 RepID=UPI0026EFE9F8|nr:UDP-glucuronic acid decarboxylase family protein [Pseudacidovorax intermedius]
MPLPDATPSRPDPSLRILVTGGAGFLGSHLCERLLRQGHRVVCADDFSTGRRANIAWALAHPRFELIQHDVREPLQLEVDRIFNLACPASPPAYQEDPVRTLETSVLGARHLLALAGRQGARILQASTSEVYGDPQVHPQPEAYWGHVNPIGPRSCYDEGKRAAETLFMDHHRHRGVDVRIARIFNTYGPRMQPDDGRVVSNFIVQALRGEPITLHGDGSQTRSFCYVDDLVEGLMRLMDCDDCGPAPVNLGNPGEFRVRDLALQVLQLTGSHSPLVERPLPVDDPLQRKPDIARAQQLLGWQPQVALAEGLQRTIGHFAQRLGRPAPAGATSDARALQAEPASRSAGATALGPLPAMRMPGA